jgi:CheY-like chemotaxis protein
MPRVLVVDDDPAIRDMLSDSLRYEGYQVETAPNGARAFEMLQSAPPDLVLLDLMMPVMSGWELLARCRGDWHYGHMRVLVLSAASSASTDGLAAEGFLPKPFELTQLLDMVERLVKPQ